MFSVKGIRKGWRFCTNGMYKGKASEIGEEPPRINLSRVVTRRVKNIFK